MKIAHLLNGTVVVTTYLPEHREVINFPHVVIDREILEPIESWYIEDGKIKIDQEKLIEYNRSQIQSLNKREFRKRLRDAKLFEQVEDYVNNSNDGYLQDAWGYSEQYSRTDELLVSVFKALGLTDEQIDEIWTL